MATLTKTEKRYKISCRCGCFFLSFHDRGVASQAVVRCPICGAEEHLSGLIGAYTATAPTPRGEASPR
jgi:hypothetical protein